MDKKKRPMTAAELVALLESNPEFVAAQKNRENQFLEKEIKHKTEQAPILNELASAGVILQSLSDIINTQASFPTAIPILLKHLTQPYSDATRETLARTLADPAAKYAWPFLVAEYQKTSNYDREGTPQRVKDGLAVALSAINSDETINELIELAKDVSHGESRILLLSALRKSKSISAQRALETLVFDPNLKGEIVSWQENKKKYRSQS